nr:MAG TPA: hypothetical protein [Caudoviricetes sp.]
MIFFQNYHNDNDCEQLPPLSFDVACYENFLDVVGHKTLCSQFYREFSVLVLDSCQIVLLVINFGHSLPLTRHLRSFMNVSPNLAVCERAYRRHASRLLQLLPWHGISLLIAVIF